MAGAQGTGVRYGVPRDDTDSLLTVAQAATLLGVHPNTIRAWTDGGRLTAYRINARGDRRFRRGDVVRLLVEVGPESQPGGEPSDPDRLLRELAIFRHLALGLASSPTASSVARAVIEALRTEAEVERAAVYVVSGDTLQLVAHAGFAKAPAATRALPADEITSGTDEVVVRLATRRAASGALVLDEASAARLSPTFMRSLAATLSTSLASAALLARARREVTRARALRTVVKELTGSLDLAAVLGDVVDLTRSLFDADRAGLWLTSGGEHPFEVAAQHGLSEAFLERVQTLRSDDETIGLRAIRNRRPYATQRADTDPEVGLLRETYASEGIRTACLVPLVGADETLGILGLYHSHERTWPEEEVALVQAFADQAAVAIQNARLYRSVADQAARMRSIQDLSARLNRLTDVRAIAEAIVAEAKPLADYHDIRIYRVDWDRRMCDPIAFTREMLDADTEEAEALLRVAIGEGFTGWVAEHGEPLLINDALDDERGKTIDGTDDVPESMLIVPMLYEGRSLGVIVLSQLGFNRFTNDDLQTMSIFAGYAAQAMANATSYRQLLAQSSELERRADSQRRLLEINERLLATLDQAGVLETIADGLKDVVVYDNLSIYRADHELRVMQPVLTREHHAEEVGRYVIPFGRGLMGWAIEHMQPILANDALSDPRSLQIPGTPEDPEAVVVVPLIADGEVLGALNVSRVGGPEVYFSASDFELVQLFAAQASIALRNADTHHAVSKLADTDALTGFGNHGAFQRDLTERVDVSEARGRPQDNGFSVLMMDLDRFKAYNDRHGHPAGDALLHRAANAIYGAARTDDLVYRYGGDEFILILPGTTAEQAARVGNRVRRAVAALTDEDLAPVTITVGVATYPADATTRAGLIAAADAALYYGKRSGTDRVVRADGLTPDVGDLRGTLEELASAALRDATDEHAVEHIVERATRMAAADEEPEHESVRDALLTISRSVESGGAASRGHVDRVGRLAQAVAHRLDLDEDEARCIELAARLQTLDEAGVAELAPIPSLQQVANLIDGHRRLTAAGARRRRRAARARGDVGPHIIGVASTYDELISGFGRVRVGRAEALDELRGHPATFRLDVIEALARVVAQRPDVGHRRRRSDAEAEEARGAA
jgi:diguanylate cyclase (GGDEF)-like protein/excisionase family DNA binding protein